MKSKAFSLVEVLIVITILAIIASMSSASYSRHIVRSKITNGVSVANKWLTKITAYHAKYGSWPDADDLGVDNGSSSVYVSRSYLPNNIDYIEDFHISSGKFTILFDASELGLSGDLTIRYVPSFTAGLVTWNCTKSDFTPTSSDNVSYLPLDCQDAP